MKWLAHTVISVGVTDLMVMLLSRRLSAWDVVNAKFRLDALSHPETAQRMVVLLPETTLLAHRGLYPIIPTFLFTSSPQVRQMQSERATASDVNFWSH